MVKPVCVVTGGRGLVARHLVSRLLESRTWVVRILDLAPKVVLSPDEKVLENHLATGNAQYVCADLRDKDMVLQGLKGASVVFHMAAPDSSISDYALHHAVSVTGTQNVIDACLHHGAKKLIYTSSPSAVFTPGQPVRDGDESTPYPLHFMDAYSETKAKGEQLVLAANGEKGLLTCAIRPSAIFGPGDKLFLPSLVAAARKGNKFVIGDGENKYDFTYVDNVVHGHICAERALGAPGSPSEGESATSGKAYFITNGEPVKFWEFIGRLLEGLGYEKPKYKLPANVVVSLAYAVEWAAKKLGRSPGQFTPARMRTVSAYRTYNTSRAQKLLGYAPVVSLDEAVKQTVLAFSHLRKEEAQDKSKRAAPSKVHRVLGNDTFADVLLWRDFKRTAAYLMMLSLVYYYLLVRSYNVVDLVARLLLVAVLGSFCYTVIPARLLGNKLPKFPDSPMQLPEEPFNSAALCIRSWWNSFAGVITALVQEKKSSLLLQVLLVLRGVNFLGKFSVRSLLAFTIVGAFTLPYAYDRFEVEIDKLFASVMELSTSYKNLVVNKLPASVTGQTKKND